MSVLNQFKSRLGRKGKQGFAGATVVALALMGALGSGLIPSAPAKETAPPSAAIAPVALASLPQEAHTTYRLIHAGGPFPYSKDGTVFGNREKLLPRRPRGEYREYTVDTPGSKNRGARRIVCAGLPPERPSECFYTSDHYASFKRIVQ
jgi:ribonuclease T1